MSHQSAEIIGLLIAAIGLGCVALMQLIWGLMSDAWKAWRKRRVDTRESIKRIEESTVNSHETNLRDDVDDVRTRLDSVERTVTSTADMLNRVGGKLDYVSSVVQDVSDRLATEERDRQALGEQSRLDPARFDRELRHLKSRLDRLPNTEN